MIPPDSPASVLSQPLPFPAHLPAGTEMIPRPPSARRMTSKAPVSGCRLRRQHHQSRLANPPSVAAIRRCWPPPSCHGRPAPQLPLLQKGKMIAACSSRKGLKRGEHLADVLLEEGIAAAQDRAIFCVNGARSQTRESKKCKSDFLCLNLISVSSPRLPSGKKQTMKQTKKPAHKKTKTKTTMVRV